MGAQNIALVLPDADKEDALTMLANAAFGACGQRCSFGGIGLSVVISLSQFNEIWLLARLQKTGRWTSNGLQMNRSR